MQAKIKSWLTQDMFEKPQEMVLYRKKLDGGLNLTNIKFKMKAFLITNFLQTACNSEFKRNYYHNSLFEYYINDTGLKAPPIPPYYPKEFFQEIKQAQLNGHEIATMKVRDWYELLLKENMTHEKSMKNIHLKVLEWKFYILQLITQFPFKIFAKLAYP